MKFLILFILGSSLSCYHVIGQTLTFNETIDYINNGFVEAAHQVKIIGNQDKNVYLTNKISVDSTGLLTVRTYTNRKESIKRTVYLKSIGVLRNIKIFYNPDSSKYYYLGIYCTDPENSHCIHFKDDESSSNEFRALLVIDDYTIAKRIKNAFTHLIELAKLNDSFYAKDPFD